MDRTRRQRADALFDRSLELAADQRDAFLAARCPEEPDIRAEVSELLRLVDAPAPALDEGCGLDLLPELVGERDVAAAWPRAGDVIGAWRIERPIGQGGMGAVFLVQRCDGQFAQTGALKLIRAGLDTEGITRRFERERQIVASLTHPGIARLLDGGRTPDGRPYFVMEYVEGARIDTDCDGRRLSIDERLALFERVCRAVQHAHGQLVIHRDVKPSNIVVTPEGDVKLLDFGIARIVGPSDVEQAESVDVVSRILTPDYASPEQVRGEPVGTASDVYQLGLLLYELLTGERAQHAAGRALRDLDRAVCETVPPPPSERIASANEAACRARRAGRRALVRRLRGDLDVIVGCALRKEPHRRYASVADLIEDVRRYRHALPIRARGDSFVYRARKFTSRHRVSMASAAAVLATVAVIAPVVTGERMRAAQQRQRARQVEDVLGQIFTLSSAPSPGRAPSAGELADHATRLVRRELDGQPASQARLLTMLGEVYTALGRYGTAIDALQDAHATHAREFGPDSAEAAQTLVALARTQHYSGRYEEAEQRFRRAWTLHRERLGPAHPETIGVALELGDLLHTRGRLVAAGQVLQDAVGQLRAPGSPPELMSRALRDLGNVTRDRGDLARAETLFRDALRYLGEADFDTTVVTALAEVQFARLLARRGAHAEAGDLLQGALRTLRQSYGGDHPTTVLALQNLGYLRAEEGRYEEAGRRLDEANRVAREWLGAGHPLVARITADRGELAARRARPLEAIATAQEALAHFDRHGLAGHPAAIDAHWTLGRALLAADRPLEAAEVLRAGLALAGPVYVRGDERLARARELLLQAGAAAPATR